MKYYVLSILLVVSACSFKKNYLDNQTQNGHEELYSEPDDVSENNVKTGYQKVVIAATNDISGNLGTRAIKIRDNHNKDALHIEVGGADVLSSYLNILRQKNKSVVLVDSGDVLPSDASDYKAVQDFYSLLKYDAISSGLTDMSMRSAAGVNPVKTFAEGSQVPVIASNLYELKTARGVEWKGTTQYHIADVNGIKVGIIGLLPDDISSLTPVNNRVGLYLENMLQSTLHQARRLRSLGATIIIVLSHQGLDCGLSIAETSKLPLSKVNFEPKKDDACDLKSPLGTYLQRLPPRLVDLVVAGRNHRKVANFINDIAVVSGFEDGKSFSYVEFLVDEKTSKVAPEFTTIHQPVMVCREFFKETNDCYSEDPSVNHKERIPAKFLGVPVERDEEVRSKFKKFFDDVSVGFSDPTSVSKEVNADISYRTSSGSSSQLVLIEISGKELSTWLDKSYNLEETSSWQPSPFKTNGADLEFVVSGTAVAFDKKYRILTDLESLQMKPSLATFITSTELKTLDDMSWDGKISMDEVSTSAASIR